MRRQAGLSLVEVSVALGIFSILMVLLAAAFSGAVDTWRRSSAGSVAASELNKARYGLIRDVKEADAIQTTTVPPSLPGGGFDGDAVWFLSAVDPATGQFLRKADGTPFWQRNILYYLVVPLGHQDMYGYSCSGGRGTDDYDDRCPHKMLVRKLIDADPPTDPADEATEESLLTDVTPFLTRPNRFDTTAMLGEAGVEEARIKAQSLLWIRVQLASQPGWREEVSVDLRATSVGVAQREIRVGTVPLENSRFTTQYQFSVFPGNWKSP